MAEMGLGADGYLRVQKESVYGTGVTSAMTLLPIKPGTILNATDANIEQGNVIASRLKQAPELGRKLITGNIIMDMHPSLIGLIYNFMFGAAGGTTDNADGSYSHYWLQDLSAERDGSIFTTQLAQGSELADQFVSGMISKITIESDNEGLVQLTAEVIYKDYSTDIARISSFSYPALVPLKFDQIAITEAGLGAITAEALTIEIDLNYDTERFKLGDDTVNRVVFNGIPQVTMTMTIDADQQFLDAARVHTAYDFTVTLTGSDNAGTTPTKYSTAFEFPGCRLNPELATEQTQERLKMDLEFDCSYGGTSTNSGADSVQFEVRVTDTESSYTA